MCEVPIVVVKFIETKWNGGYQGLREGKRTEFQFAKMRKVWRWMAVVVNNHVGVLNATEPLKIFLKGDQGFTKRCFVMMLIMLSS